MPIDTELEKLIINKGLTKEQFEQAFAEGSIGDNDFSFVDDIIDGIQNKITNSITEIPQDIKLELNNGTLTLKAGSKVYVPNGFEVDGITPKFDEVVVESDMQAVIPDIQRTGAFLTYNINGRGDNLYHWSQWNVGDLYSGVNAPTTSGNKIWYDTANNIIKEMNDGQNWTALKTSFPFCTFSGTPASVTSIDQIFNGFGYIGSTVFALPNVKGLVPNGRNEDGTLKNIEFVTDGVLTRTFSYELPNSILLFSPNRPNYPFSTIYIQDIETQGYDEITNSFKSTAINGYGVEISLVNIGSGGTITNFKPKLPFRAVDWNDFPTITYWE